VLWTEDLPKEDEGRVSRLVEEEKGGARLTTSATKIGWVEK